VDRAITDLNELTAEAERLSEDAFARRVALLEAAEDICEVLRHAGYGSRPALRRAQRLVGELEASNAAYCARLRQGLLRGSLTPAELRSELDRLTAYTPERRALHIEQEPADRLVDGIMRLERFRGSPTIEDRDFVHLEDSPVRVLLDLIDHVSLAASDCFFDLGSGLGRAALLVHWLSGVRARGVEVQPEYHAFADSLAGEFRLERVRFERADVRDADLSEGTVFYLFTPFKGRILDALWAKLQQEARSRAIRVCTYGAISLAAARLGWLHAADGDSPHEFSLAVWQAGPAAR